MAKQEGCVHVEGNQLAPIGKAQLICCRGGIGDDGAAADAVDQDVDAAAFGDDSLHSGRSLALIECVAGDADRLAAGRADRAHRSIDTGRIAVHHGNDGAFAGHDGARGTPDPRRAGGDDRNLVLKTHCLVAF